MTSTEQAGNRAFGVLTCPNAMKEDSGINYLKLAVTSLEDFRGRGEIDPSQLSILILQYSQPDRQKQTDRQTEWQTNRLTDNNRMRTDILTD